jgi:hypothetical protein
LMMSQDTVLSSQRLLADDCELIGLAKVEFQRKVFYRITPSQSRFVAFLDGFYHYEIEQHGRWCSERGLMSIHLDAGEWQVIIPIAGDQIGKAPTITSANFSAEPAWVQGGAIWAAAVIDARLMQPILQLEFRARNCSKEPNPGNAGDTRHLCFWMLDEILVRPLALSSPPLEQSGSIPHTLVSDIANARIISASSDTTALQERIIPLTSSNSGEQVSMWIVHSGIVVGRPSILGFYSSGQLFFLQETVPYTNRLLGIRESCSRSLRRSTLSFAKFDQVAALCCEWSENIWHWFLECVPKAMALEDAGFLGIYLVPCNSSVFRDSLMLLGIDGSRVREFVYDYVEANELFVTEQVTGHQLTKYPRLISNINEGFRRRVAFTSGAKRLYIARRSIRKVVNEAEVLSALKEYDFRLVYMEDYTITEQIGLAAAAECIAGPHGAGMTFVMFMKPGGTMLEFFSPTYVNPCMTAICDILRIGYFMITSRIYIGRPYPHGVDIEVDIPTLKLTLRTALGNRESL